jgi:hypothetical protein
MFGSATPYRWAETCSSFTYAALAGLAGFQRRATWEMVGMASRGSSSHLPANASPRASDTPVRFPRAGRG